MAEGSHLGRLLLVLGIGLVLLGSALILSAWFLKGSRLPWLGRLPGDIHIESKGLSCYFPLATSILVSLVLSLVLNIIVRLLNR